MSVTFSRIQRETENAAAGALYTAYCIACGRTASVEIEQDDEKNPRNVLIVMRQLRSMLMKAGCAESGVTGSLPRPRGPSVVPR